MAPPVHPYLTEPDIIVLRTLLKDVPHSAEQNLSSPPFDHHVAIDQLKAINNPQSEQFQPTVFVSWDDKDIPLVLNRYIVKPYTRLASRIVRHPTDVVFFTHILLYLFVNLPSAIILYRHFTYIHAVAHVAFTFWCTGSYTLLMHNHIHNNGVLSKSWHWLDLTFPYITEPLMGHTWDSYYYHHVKHHHVEGNGPDDLSSTIRYQRDDPLHFLHYLTRFLFLIWLDLPLYFLRKRKPLLAVRAAGSEFLSYALMYVLTAHVSARASTAVLLIPFLLLRVGLMVGNWGQHALVDERAPDADLRSSITLLDVPSNRFCFNDGYHTSHHLNPRRHWRDHPAHLLASHAAYADGRALVFADIDYLMLTVTLLRKDYARLAACLVPISEEQARMSQAEIAEMLRTKTRKFSEEEIRVKFRTGNGKGVKADEGMGGGVWARWRGVLASASGWAQTRPVRVEADFARKDQ